MEKITKEQITVKVLDRNRKHIKKTLKMFGAVYTHELEECTFLFFNKNVLLGCYYHKKGKILVSHKQLRTILAKEHLKVGDYIVGKNNEYKFVGKFLEFRDEQIFVSNWRYLGDDDFFKNDRNTGGSFTNFKRYATPEEIALLDPNKELEVGKWYKGNIDFNSLVFITEIDKKKGFNSIHGYGFKSNGWNYKCHLFSNTDHEKSLVEATPQEVESALTEEAIKRGHKYEKFVYNSEENALFGYNGRLEEVFVNGKWNDPFEKFDELKEAHRNGAEIQVKYHGYKNWEDCDNPMWIEENEYRIKPSFDELPEPNVLVWAKRKDGVYLAKRNGNPRSRNQDTAVNCDWSGVPFYEIKEPSNHNSGVYFDRHFSDITVEEWRYIQEPKF